MNDHVITSQIQPELAGKTLNHLHGPLYNLDKGHEFSRRRVVADSKQLVTAFLASEDSDYVSGVIIPVAGAMLGA